MPAAERTMTLLITTISVTPMTRITPCSRFATSCTLATSRSSRLGSTAALTSRNRPAKRGRLTAAHAHRQLGRIHLRHGRRVIEDRRRMLLERRQRRKVRDDADDLIPAIEGDVLRECLAAPSDIADALAERARAAEQPRRQRAIHDHTVAGECHQRGARGREG